MHPAIGDIKFFNCRHCGHEVVDVPELPPRMLDYVAMPRCPQFTLKTAVAWLTLLPAAIGTLATSIKASDGTEGHPLLLLAGLLFGACIGPCKGASQSLMGAFFGALLAWPAFVVGVIVFAVCGLVEID
jgi:hypothetical protein